MHGREDGRAVKLWVVNESDTAVRLRRAVRIERRVGVDWQAVDVSAVWLREDCRPRDGILFWQGGEDECVDIAARRTFESIGWMGMIGDAQCACEECGRAPRGEYRFLVTTCAGAVQASEPFALTGR